MRLLVILLFIGKIVSAQSTGTIRFVIDQNNGFFEVLVNDTLVISKYRDTLPVGVYKAQIWSPGYEIVDTSFVIKENIETIHFLKLKRSDEYVQNSKINVARNKKRSLYFRLPVATAFTGYCSAMVLSFSVAKQLKSTDLFIADYKNLGSLGYVQQFKLELLQRQNQYNNTRLLFYTGLFVGMASTAVAIFNLRFLQKKYPKISLFNTNSPFTEKLSVVGSVNSISLRLSL